MFRKNVAAPFPNGNQPDLWQGALWKILSMGCFAMINGIVRYCAGGTESLSMDPLPVHVLVFFQNLFGTLCLLPWILHGTQRTSPFMVQAAKPSRKESRLHLFLNLLRVLSAVLGIGLWYFSLKYMPIAESTALGFTGPVFTVIGAWLLLHEKMDARRVMAIGLSFVGAFVIARPDIPLHAHHMGLAALLPLGSAFALALSKLLTRRLVLLGYSPSYLAASLMLWMTPVSLPLALLEWQSPALQHWPWLMLMGFLAACSHVTFGKAYQLADVGFLAPFGFSKFMLGSFIGYCFFAEFPTAWSLWVGMAIIFSSMLVLGYKIPLYSKANRLRSS